MNEKCESFLCETETAPTVSEKSERGVLSPAQAYIPPQPWETPKTPEQSLICGTAFSVLSQPYCKGFSLYRNRKEDAAWNDTNF